jgi:hypothetical protein
MRNVTCVRTRKSMVRVVGVARVLWTSLGNVFRENPGVCEALQRLTCSFASTSCLSVCPCQVPSCPREMAQSRKTRAYDQ